MDLDDHSRPVRITHVMSPDHQLITHIRALPASSPSSFSGALRFGSDGRSVPLAGTHSHCGFH
jgi:hypothetical protein